MTRRVLLLDRIRLESRSRSAWSLRRARAFLRRKIVGLECLSARLTRRFHELYYYSSKRTWQNTFFLGVPVRKCPLDLWVYQEIIHRTRPDVLVECGTNVGGSALFFAHTLDDLGRGRVITIDVESFTGRPSHPRIVYLCGSSLDRQITTEVQSQIGADETVMVVLDSDHRKDHVLSELESYAPLVTSNSYLVVEDTNVNGHPVRPEYGPGPMEAVKEFLGNHGEFEVDRSCEKFFVTFNPGGWLKRVR